MPRFNLSWFYMFIAMTIAYLWFTSDENSGVDTQLTYTEFKNMVNKGYANKIIAYNDNTVDLLSNLNTSRKFLRTTTKR